jgi:hippurate hydrolase
MSVKQEIEQDQQLLTGWRRDLHAHPEIAFEEHRTSSFVAERLESFGIEVHRGLAKTGVVGQLKAGSGNRAIALRADMDALPMDEHNAFDHRSEVPGMMHACGHDGHTTMLLGAAKYLAETKGFDGTVYFIFQPAEEAEGGGEVMVKEGLFEQFPVEAVFGLHNWPGMPAGQFGIAAGPMMAAFDTFDLKIAGKGSHGAMPHQGVDAIVTASQGRRRLQHHPRLGDAEGNGQDLQGFGARRRRTGDAAHRQRHLRGRRCGHGARLSLALSVDGEPRRGDRTGSHRRGSGGGCG